MLLLESGILVKAEKIDPVNVNGHFERLIHPVRKSFQQMQHQHPPDASLPKPAQDEEFLDRIDHAALVQYERAVAADEPDGLIPLIDCDEIYIIVIADAVPIMDLKYPEIKQEFFLFTEKLVDPSGIMVFSRPDWICRFQHGAIIFIGHRTIVDCAP